MWVLGRLGEWVSFLTWNLLLALLYLFRKCIFLVSFQQLFSHCVQVYQFLISTSNYAQSSTALRARKIVRKQKNSSDDKRNHRFKRDLRKDDISGNPQSFFTKSGLPKDLGKDLSKPFDRKVSTTLLNINHQDNYARNRDFWTEKSLRSSEGSPGRRGSDSDTSVYSCKDSMGNSMDSERLVYSSKPVHNSTPVHETGSTGSKQYNALQRNSSNYRSSDSTDSFILVDKINDSDQQSSDDEFIRAFQEEDEYSEDEREIKVLNTSSDSTDFSLNATTQEFMKITEGREMMEILNDFSSFISRIGIIPGHINNFFPAFRTFVKHEVPFKFNDLLDKLEKRRQLPEYKGGLVGRGKKVLIIGAGPCGLRLALETQLLGAETTVIESRSSIDRNNILKLWSFVVEDLRGLGGKKLCPNLGISCLNHMSIKTLQLILLKICLILGVRIKPRQTFKAILEPSSSSSWPVLSDIQCDNGEFAEEEEEFDVVIGATGRRVTLEGFERQSLEAKMAIAITANFRNFNTEDEKYVKEIPGLSKQYDLQFFTSLEHERGIKLENIVYYQGDTHYFVMTAKKESLLRKGVLYRDLGERMELLRPENVNRRKLEEYAREASEFSTAHFSKQLPRLPFAEWKGVKDVSIFDFTNLYRSQNASRIIQRRGFTLLTGLVGDSLLEPFWPEGTGIGQGFLGAFDTAWMVKRYFEKTDLYETIREREKLYCLLRQSTQTSLKKNFESWTIDPRSRYNTTQFHFNQSKVFQLLDSDVPSSLDQIDSRDSDGVKLRRKSKKHYRSHKLRETMFFAD